MEEHDSASVCEDVPVSQQAFRDAVREFVTIHDRLAEIRKDTSMLNKRKKKLSEVIVTFMKSTNKDFCNLGEKGTLQMKESKTTQTLKKDQVISLLAQFGQPEESATEMGNYLFDNRITKVKSVIRRSTKQID
jgi:seryl-tRNA synthetase